MTSTALNLFYVVVVTMSAAAPFALRHWGFGWISRLIVMAIFIGLSSSMFGARMDDLTAGILMAMIMGISYLGAVLVMAILDLPRPREQNIQSPFETETMSGKVATRPRQLLSKTAKRRLRERDRHLVDKRV